MAIYAKWLAGGAGIARAARLFRLRMKWDNGSIYLAKYADMFDFDVLKLDSFSPQSFIGGLHAAEENGYHVFLCDSLSHFWTGKDGAWYFVDIAQKRHKDQMGGWKEFRTRAARGYSWRGTAAARTRASTRPRSPATSRWTRCGQAKASKCSST